jgi:hypothetical protein
MFLQRQRICALRGDINLAPPVLALDALYRPRALFLLPHVSAVSRCYRYWWALFLRIVLSLILRGADLTEVLPWTLSV